MYKVVIADDEPLILKGLANLIDWEDLDLEICFQANCGSDAFEYMTNNDVHILITDIKMPYMDGLELIKSIREKGILINIIILSGYDDFRYVKESINYGIENYILKPVSEVELISTLKTCIQKIENRRYTSDLLRNNVLNRWMKNDIEKDELIEKSSFLNINLSSKNYCTLIAKVNNFDTGKASNTLGELVSIFEKIFSINNSIIVFDDFDGNIVVLLSDFSEIRFKKLIRETITSCTRKIRDIFHKEVFVTIGSIESSWENVYVSYNNAKMLQEYSLLMPINSIISYDEISSNSNNMQSRLNLNYEEFINYILIRDKNAIFRWIDDAYSKIKTYKNNINPLTIKNFTTQLLFLAISTAKNSNSSIEIFENYSEIFKSAHNIKTIDELAYWMKLKTEELIDVMILNKVTSTKLINRVLSYVQSNYQNNINLNTISQVFDVNPAYLGQLFKKDFGKSFTNYINELRVEKAKTLLINESMKINDISKKIGYPNVNYFCTIFRKITGYSPSEYYAANIENDIRGKFPG